MNVSNSVFHEPLTRAFFLRSVDVVAADLIGCLLVTDTNGERVGGVIVDTEAYDQNDPAAHCHEAVNRKGSESMRLPGGHAYVCKARHGMSWLNFTCDDRPDFGSAVLIGALQPLCGCEIMRKRRLEGYAEHRGINDEKKYRNFLCRGPGALSEALGVTVAVDKMSLFAQPFQLFGPATAQKVLRGPRIRVTSAVCDPRRFALADCAFIRPESRAQLRPM